MPTHPITVTPEEAEAVIALAGQGSTVTDLAEVLSTSEEHVVELLERVRADKSSQSRVESKPATRKPNRTVLLIVGVALVCFAFGAMFQGVRAKRALLPPVAAPVATTANAGGPTVPAGTPTMVVEKAAAAR